MKIPVWLFLEMKEGRTDRLQNDSKDTVGFILEKWSCWGGAQQETWSPQSLQTGGIYEVDGKVPARSLDRIIIYGPLTLLR
jgi:hypothetical protein